MVDEVTLFKYLKRKIKGAGVDVEWQRHEDQLSTGISDVSYSGNQVNGWIELKASDTWPVEFRTKLRKRQRIYLTLHGTKGGHCFVLHQLGEEYLLYDYTHVFSMEGLCKEDVISKACAHWQKGGALDERLIDTLFT